MKKICTAALLAIGFFANAQTQPQESDDEITCENLIKFAHGDFDQNIQIFGTKKEEWSYKIVNKIEEAISFCENSARSTLRAKQKLTVETNVQLVNGSTIVRNKARFLANSSMDAIAKAKAKADAVTAERKKQQDEAEARKFAAEAKKQCQKGHEYDTYETEQAIINAVAETKYIEKQKEWQRKVERESGVTDMYAMRELGKRTVENRESLNGIWAYYKKHGGKATSPSAVKHTLANPCP